MISTLARSRSIHPVLRPVSVPGFTSSPSSGRSTSASIARSGPCDAVDQRTSVVAEPNFVAFRSDRREALVLEVVGEERARVVALAILTARRLDSLDGKAREQHALADRNDLPVFALLDRKAQNASLDALEIDIDVDRFIRLLFVVAS